jgi:DNA-3-methyladenine glycosylase I
MMHPTPTTCAWSVTGPAMIAYHDEEWGVPVHGDTALFEHLMLDGFQAGLSWAVVLNKRERFREVFDGFDPEKIARYTKRKIDRLVRDPGIIRNRLKIEATRSNARALLQLQEEVGSFDAFLWQFVGGVPKQNRWRSLKQLPARSRESDAMSAALKQRGFKFVGSTICYAFMQATGLVNDHIVTCFRHEAVRRLGGEAS